MLLVISILDSIPTVREVVNETKEVTRWFSLGIQLEIKPEDLHQIGDKYSSDTEQCKTEVVTFWIRNTRKCTWGRLANAVENMGGHSNLVHTLRKSHGSSGMLRQ